MVKNSSKDSRLSHLSTVDSHSREFNVIIETPKGSRNKFKYDEEYGLFKLGGLLPVGAVFPYDFGFLPSTLGGDGDPLDVLVLMDEPAFAGCLVQARLLGAIEAEQTEDGETSRNDRLIAVATNTHTLREVRSLDQLSESKVNEIEHFFISYSTAKGKQFKPIGRFGPGHAERLVEEGTRDFRRQNSASPKLRRQGHSKAKKH
jgi:inorganic pyrophosphatase